MIFLRKIKASALQLTLLVSVIIAILLSSFLTLSHLQRLFHIQSDALVEVVRASQKGIDKSLETNPRWNDSIDLQFNGIAVSLKKNYWGSFQKIQSSASFKTKSFNKWALINSEILSPKSAIFATGSNRPLILLGETKIKGVAHVNSKGVQAGVIPNHSYKGGELVHGVLYKDAILLPKLDLGFLTYIRFLIKNGFESYYEIIPQQNRLSVSFEEPSKYIFDTNTITLSESYIGNIIIKSTKEIIVTPMAHLEDVVLIAPKITVQSGFKGNMHLIADESIKVEKNTILTYPSSLILWDKNADTDTPIPQGEEPIFLDESVTFQGNIIYLPQKEPQNKTQCNIRINKNVLVLGQIYCDGNIETRATILGSVYTQNFLAFFNGSNHVNYILDATFDTDGLPDGFSGLPFESGSKTVAKWLY